MECSRLDDRGQLIARVLVEKRRRDRSAVDADANRDVVVARDIDQPFHLLLDGLRLLDMVQMPRVVANLVDVRRDPVGDFVVLLQIDRQHDALRLRADFLDRRDFLLAVDRDAHDSRARVGELMRLRDGLVDVDRPRRAHRLHHHRRVAADLGAANRYLPCFAIF